MNVSPLLIAISFLFAPVAARAEEQFEKAYLSGLNAGILMGGCILYTNQRLAREDLDWLYQDIRSSNAGKKYKESVDQAVVACKKNGVSFSE